MNRYPIKPLIVLVALFSLGSFSLVDIVNPGKSLDWFIALTATLLAAGLAAVIGLSLFHYEDETTEDRLIKKLDMRVAAELKLNLEILSNRPTPIFANTQSGQAIGEVRLVELSTKALADLIRSDPFSAEEALKWMRLEAHINVHNSEVASLLAARVGFIKMESLLFMVSELSGRQSELREDFGGLLQHLRDQDTVVPD